MARFISLFCIVGIVLACGSSPQAERPAQEVSGFIFDEFANAIQNAEIKIIETTYSPNLTDNNNGFSKFIQNHGTCYSNVEGHFQVSVSESNGIREIQVDKQDYKPYTGVLNKQKFDTIVMESLVERLPTKLDQLSIEIE